MVTLAFACAAHAASATTYCVTMPAPPPSCTGTNETDLTSALAAASADTTSTTSSDVITLPTGTQTGSSPYTYTGKVPLEIVGQGTGSVVTITTGSSANPVFQDSGTENLIELDRFEVSLPSGESAGGIVLTANALIGNVAVIGATGSTGYGIVLGDGGVVKGVTVSIPPGNDPKLADSGIVAEGKQATTIQDSLIGDRTGIEADGPGATTIHRVAITATNSGAGIYTSGSAIAADDSLIVPSQGASGLAAIGAASGGTTITATQLTIAGDSSATGVHVEGASGGNALVNLTDSIIADPLTNSFLVGEAPGTTATVTTDYDDFDQKSVSGTVAIGAHDTKETSADPTGFENPEFANTAKNNYRLLPSSPLLSLDRTPLGSTPVGAGESTMDLSEEPRITGGGRDLGAYQHQPPTATASATPTTARAHAPISFSATGTIIFKNDPLKFTWHFDDGTVGTGQNVTHGFTTGGRHSGTVTVSDLLGFTATAMATVTIDGPPMISHASESRKKWRTGNALAHISRKRKQPPVGTVFKFQLSEAARVTLAFTGHKGHHRYTARLTFNGHAGRNTIRFDGRVSRGNKLKPASYKLAITAVAFGFKSSASTLHFTIVSTTGKR